MSTMACTYGVNRHGNIYFRLYSPIFPNGTSWEGSKLKDTPEDNRTAKVRSDRITSEMKAGTFDYLYHFPNGNRAEFFKGIKANAEPKTIRQYFETWRKDKIPPFIRLGRAQHYASHFKVHILPIHGDKLMEPYGVADIREIRSRLVSEHHLKLNSARDVLNASLRAMFRDAEAEGIIAGSPFDDLPPRFWPQGAEKQPDPFGEGERDEIIAYLDKKYRQTWARGCAFMFTLFWTGARPSELTARRFSDYDPRTGRLSISSSRSRSEEGATKTAGSNRTIPLLGPVQTRLDEIRPLRVEPDDYIFTNREGRPIDQGHFARHYFWPCLRALNIRHRPLYNTRHTFISVMLTHGENLKELADYCGTSPAMIDKHYGKWLGGTGTFGQAALNAKPEKKSEVG